MEEGLSQPQAESSAASLSTQLDTVNLPAAFVRLENAIRQKNTVAVSDAITAINPTHCDTQALECLLTRVNGQDSESVIGLAISYIGEQNALLNLIYQALILPICGESLLIKTKTGWTGAHFALALGQPLDVALAYFSQSETIDTPVIDSNKTASNRLVLNSLVAFCRKQKIPAQVTNTLVDLGAQLSTRYSFADLQDSFPRMARVDYRSALKVGIAAMQENEWPVADQLAILLSPDDDGFNSIAYARKIGDQKLLNLFFNLVLEAYRKTSPTAPEEVGIQVSEKTYTLMHLAILCDRTPSELNAYYSREQSYDYEQFLHFAIANECITAVQHLAAKVSINRPSTDLEFQGQTALHTAVRHGSLESFKVLLRQGADWQTSNAAGETVLAVAIRLGHDRIVEALFLQGETLPAAYAEPDSQGYAQLKPAVQQILDRVRAGELVNHELRKAISPPEQAFIEALREANLKKLSILLQGTEESLAPTFLPLLAQEVRPDSDETWLQYCQAKKCQGILDTLFDQVISPENNLATIGPHYTLAEWAVLLYQSDERVLNAQEDQSPEAFSALLRFSAYHGLEQSLACLKENGAILDDQDNDENTALYIAIQQKHFDVACELLTRGASVRLKNAGRQTALHLAILSGNLGCVEKVLEKVALLDSVVKKEILEDDSLLMCAIQAENSDTLNALFKAGLKPSEQACHDAMRTFCINGHTTMLFELLRTGFIKDLDKKMNTKSALHVAAEHKQPGCIAMLLDAGANPLCKDGNGKTVVVLAEETALTGISPPAEYTMTYHAQHSSDAKLERCCQLMPANKFLQKDRQGKIALDYVMHREDVTLSTKKYVLRRTLEAYQQDRAKSQKLYLSVLGKLFGFSRVKKLAAVACCLLVLNGRKNSVDTLHKKPLMQGRLGKFFTAAVRAQIVEPEKLAWRTPSAKVV